MILTAENVAHYLLDRGLISADSVVDGDLVIADATSRHRNFKIIRRRQPGYFVKQAQQTDPQTLGFLQRESTCYWLASRDPAFQSLGKLVPRYELYDPQRYILVVELLPEGENLSEYHRRQQAFPLAIGAGIGTALGAYHAQIRLSAVDPSYSTAFPRTIPWILSVHRLGTSPMQSFGGANSQVMAVIARFSDFHNYLDALREQWRFDCFIHGDMKWENCIAYPDNGGLSVRVVDWETADFGDACWDVGAIFQSYMTFWIMSIPMQGSQSPEQYLAAAPYPIEVMQPAIRAFWLGYCQARRLSPAEQRDVLLRSTGMAAARMLQTAYEYMYHSPQITLNALALLQVSLNILTDTPGAVRELLNL